MDLLEKMKKARETKVSTIKKKLIVKKIPKKPVIDVESDEITIDEARAQYIVICKKKPKHDSIHTKNWLINEVIKKLEQSKI